MRRIIPALLAALALAILAACGGPVQLKGTAIEPPKTAPDFTLTDELGQSFTLSEQKGKVVVLFFGFTSCPDICPAELSNLAAATRQLGDDAQDVQVALVSLDPQRDTSERLSTYVTAFDPSFKGLRGDKEVIDPIVKDYGVFYEIRELPGSALGYTVDHSGFVYVIDKAGRWREVLAHGTPVADIVADLQALARER
jgi:protein SCO1/2